MNDILRMRQTMRVLELLDISAGAFEAGDRSLCWNTLREVIELDAVACMVVFGGIHIGEIPDPHEDPAGWRSYVEGCRARLAEMEAEVASEATSDRQATC